MSRRTDIAYILVLTLGYIISCQANVRHRSCRTETFQTYKENRIPSVLTESYCLANGEFCGPSHEVRRFTSVLLNVSYFTLISVWTIDEFAWSGICEGRPDRTQAEYDHWRWLCLHWKTGAARLSKDWTWESPNRYLTPNRRRIDYVIYIEKQYILLLNYQFDSFSMDYATHWVTETSI